MPELVQRFGAAKPGIALQFLRNRGHMAVLVVVRRIDERVLGQREDLLAHRAVQRFGIAVLKIGTRATVNEKGIAREDALAGAVIQQVAVVCVGMPGREDRPQRQAADLERAVFGHADEEAGREKHRHTCIDLQHGKCSRQRISHRCG